MFERMREKERKIEREKERGEKIVVLSKFYCFTFQSFEWRRSQLCVG